MPNSASATPASARRSPSNTAKENMRVCDLNSLRTFQICNAPLKPGLVLVLDANHFLYWILVNVVRYHVMVVTQEQ